MKETKKFDGNEEYLKLIKFGYSKKQAYTIVRSFFYNFGKNYSEYLLNKFKDNLSEEDRKELFTTCNVVST